MDRALLRSLDYLRSHWVTALAALGALAVMTAGTLVAPQLLRWMIDDGIQRRASGPIIAGAWGLVGVALVRGVFSFLQGYLAERVAQNVAYEMRNDIFAKLTSLSFSYHDRQQTGQLMTRLTSDVEQLRGVFGTGMVHAVSAVSMLVGTSVVLLWMEWRLALVALATIPLTVGVLARYMTRLRPMFARVQEKLAALNTVLQENIAGVSVVQSFAREPFESDRYRKVNLDLRDENLDVYKSISVAFPSLFLVTNLGTTAVVWVGGLLIMRGTATVGELVAFNAYLIYLSMPLLMMGFIATGISRASASAARVYEVLDAEIEVRERVDAADLPPVEGRVAFDHVSLRYVGAESDVLCDVSFVAEPGRTVALVGPTGSGKSSVVSLIPRFYDVRGGRVTIDGYDVRDLTLESLRRQVGVVLQEATLFSGSIRDNIAFGAPDASLEDVRAAARAAQIADFVEGLPEAYATTIGERGLTLSGGQRQRVAIARTLLLDPKVLILDDSTSAVDARTELRILEQLDELMEGRTSFVIAQRVSTVRRADLILVLDGGRLVGQGTHDEVLATSPLYGEIVDSQLVRDMPPDSRAACPDIELTG